MPSVVPDPRVAWPRGELLTSPSPADSWSDGAAYCVAYGVLDAAGRRVRSVFQGQPVSLFAEFEVTGDVGALAGWVELHDAEGCLIHGRDTFASASSAPPEPARARGARFRVYHQLQMDLSPGIYWLTLGLVSVAPDVYTAYRHGSREVAVWPEGTRPHPDPDPERWGTYRQGLLTEEQLRAQVKQHARVACEHPLTVGFDESGRLPYRGLAWLPGRSLAWQPHGAGAAVKPTQTAGSPVPVPEGAASALPAVVHVTHPNAGSQWIYRILQLCAPERVVAPVRDGGHFVSLRPEPGRIYPTVYLTRPAFDRAAVPELCRPFVVIRDLRDTLVSLYFSLATSRPVMDRAREDGRSLLAHLSQEDGLLYLLDGWLATMARIQLTWLESGQRLIRYEDLLEHDGEILEEVLLGECQLGVSRDALRQAVLASRFEQLSGGRPRGTEDRRAHLRKGIAGDWRTHFTGRVTQAFKARYGGLLVATGYEHGLDW